MRDLRYEKMNPNVDGDHFDYRYEKFKEKIFVLGEGKYQDFITNSELENCDIKIKCGASRVNLFGTKFVNCTFWPSKEMRGLRFTDVFLFGCNFKGKYTGCRFGVEDDNKESIIENCDFKDAKIFHLNEFLRGADYYSCKFPSWPHVLITDLKNSRKSWMMLKLPPTLEILQKVIGNEESISDAISVYLPAKVDDYNNIRELLCKQTYILIS